MKSNTWIISENVVLLSRNLKKRGKKKCCAPYIWDLAHIRVIGKDLRARSCSSFWGAECAERHTEAFFDPCYSLIDRMFPVSWRFLILRIVSHKWTHIPLGRKMKSCSCPLIKSRSSVSHGVRNLHFNSHRVHKCFFTFRNSIFPGPLLWGRWDVSLLSCWYCHHFHYQQFCLFLFVFTSTFFCCRPDVFFPGAALSPFPLHSVPD